MFQCQDKLRELLDLIARGSIAVFLAFIPLERPENHEIERLERIRWMWKERHVPDMVLCKKRHGLVIHVRCAVTPEQNTWKRLWVR
jgi:hypothetical protein